MFGPDFARDEDGEVRRVLGDELRGAALVVVEGPESDDPSPSYLEHVVAGARHWGLPTGWVINLEEIAEDDLL